MVMSLNDCLHWKSRGMGKRHPQCASAFTAECYVASIAVVEMINENITNSIIYTYLLSILTPLHSSNAVMPLLGDIIHTITTIRGQEHKIKSCWIPSYVGVKAMREQT